MIEYRIEVRMSLDESEFRRALGQFATGITVVTTRDLEERPQGLTVNAFCSVSLEPPLVLICVDRRAEANTGLAHTARFAVSVLSEDQEHVSRRFASGGPLKFDGLVLPKGVSGLPVIPGALATLECRVVASHDAGDHTIYIGVVEHMSCAPGRPLVYHASAYCRLAPSGSA
jgi:flavin reductase (DIM6/NTAB) family NADH-FMN oxidoreductase RutF